MTLAHVIHPAVVEVTSAVGVGGDARTVLEAIALEDLAGRGEVRVQLRRRARPARSGIGAASVDDSVDQSPARVAEKDLVAAVGERRPGPAHVGHRSTRDGIEGGDDAELLGEGDPVARDPPARSGLKRRTRGKGDAAAGPVRDAVTGDIGARGTGVDQFHRLFGIACLDGVEVHGGDDDTSGAGRGCRKTHHGEGDGGEPHR